MVKIALVSFALRPSNLATARQLAAMAMIKLTVLPNRANPTQKRRHPVSMITISSAYPVEGVRRGDRHGFRKANNDRRLVTIAAFRRVAKTKPGAFDPRKFVRQGVACAISAVGASSNSKSPCKRPRSRFPFARAKLILSETRAAAE